LTVLDVGCGTGRDVYVAAQLVGPSGRAIGLDMTAEQLEVAERTEEWHRERFGYPVVNTMFAHGDIENMRRAGIKDASIDVAISNCVVNLAADKEAVFREIWRVLKPGGELYFSDIYCDRRVPEAAQRDKASSQCGAALVVAAGTATASRSLSVAAVAGGGEPLEQVAIVTVPAATTLPCSTCRSRCCAGAVGRVLVGGPLQGGLQAHNGGCGLQDLLDGPCRKPEGHAQMRELSGCFV
jgi:SAM-dependent methyltransferase